MTSPFYLTRARLRPDASISAISRVLLPDNASARAMASHQLVWSLFAGDKAAQRDFLWREDQRGTFFILSPRPPEDSAIFKTETKPFAPELAAGDLLRFTLRANATRSIKDGPTSRGKRADVVMAALNPIPQHERAEARSGIIFSAGRSWLLAQGQRYGFELAEEAEDPTLNVDGYTKLKIPRRGKEDLKISVLEFAGALRVTDPACFLECLLKGFGHAKAFGCGLMLIRRA